MSRPRETSYFTIDPKTGNEKRDRQLLTQFQVVFGLKPTAIRIMFPPADPEVFFPQFNKRYAAGMLKCKGDGGGDTDELRGTALCADGSQAGLKVLEVQDNGMLKVACLGRDCPYQKKRQCQHSGSLQVILPDLDASGTFQIDTGSVNSIMNINSALDWLTRIWNTYMMIPVILMRIPQEVTHTDPKTGKTSTATHYVLQVDMPASVTRLRKAAMAIADESQLKQLEELKPPSMDAQAEIVESASLESTNSGTVEEDAKPSEVPVEAVNMLDPGDLSRFKQKEQTAQSMIRTIKQCLDSLGPDKFARILGDSGFSSIAEISGIEQLSALTNDLLEARNN